VAAAKTACLTTVRHGELSTVAEDFLQDPQVRQWLDGIERSGRCSPSTACRHCAWSDATAITRTADRLVTADLVVHAFALLEGFAA
jgi:hypothetical protein